MPKRTDIKSILIIGSGPIVIGQACEFDYSGVQACKALREESYRVVLVNSNPATIMTDPDIAHATYIEPIDWEVVRKIIEKERPDAMLPTMGGQTALNCALDLDSKGVLKEFGVEMIGATAHAIKQAEDRQLFDKAIKKIGLETPRSGFASNMKEALAVVANVGFPCIIRSSFTLGGTGSGIAYDKKNFEAICERGLDFSKNGKLLIEESLIGWKEYEMEVVRDHKDNCIIVCSIENIDPMGIHTGDSITVAPAQTLTDKEYQIMRNASMAVLREIGVETGGSNVQFAMHPKTGQLIIIEMNPRVSRSSALASKATGFPIAKIAAKLAVGYNLDELMNDITNSKTPASFEPSLDYVVTKIPRFNFDKFSGTNDRLTTQMKSVGEVMAIGRTQQESLQKALRSLEVDIKGFDPKVKLGDPEALTIIQHELQNAGGERILFVADAFRAGMSVDHVFHLTHIDRWFLIQIEELIQLENHVAKMGITVLKADYLRQLKRKGFADARLATLVGVEEIEIRKLRENYNLYPVYKRVDTCAAEFSTNTAYMYSTYDDECESYPAHDRKKIIVLGGGPNRIGQGTEFDYCCVHALLALREEDYEPIMVNCNPETVSTDYDISDRLYLEPVTLENVLDIVRIEQPDGVIVQYGGQTPLKLARALEAAGVPIIGTKPDAIDRAENRERFQKMINTLGLKQPTNAIVTSMDMAVDKAATIGYPIMVRPSYVLGGRAMKIIYDDIDLLLSFQKALSLSSHDTEIPVLLEQFIDDAIEVDVDAICDGKTVLICGIMEHIEQAGVHSGDSACSLPACTLNHEIQNKMRRQVEQLAFELQVIGMMNVQFAVKDNEVYLIEVNPRAARTVPFVSKATGVALAKVGTKVMIGKSLIEQGMTNEVIPPYYSVKEVVIPFNQFSDIDPILGPEMRSTGEVMGVGRTFAEAFAKAMLSSQSRIKKSGRVLLSVDEKNQNRVVDLAIQLLQHGFELDATESTAAILINSGIHVRLVNTVDKINSHLQMQERMKNGEYSYIVTTTPGGESIEYFKLMRRRAIQYKVHYNTTMNGAFATAMSLNANVTDNIISIQEMHSQMMNHSYVIDTSQT
ncbi:carbamoyl-phosphate synthase large subunit [Candidatus Palibaumannia cicadellinicola]|uniref:Carbamoyl phosphate synthase large chain n=1 Tax=Candidatus Palibaumannia cicadellinicola TaxID=186490 RepID=A0A088N2C1_9GAMM|nr:carbamoyl-phosphate synthase large subunit [Candidatus Baumannia cicadellinicola]AIN47481.1 Carbamoyl-phosphate synthase large chain [Candidatus Baumannia cicadellinicola]